MITDETTQVIQPEKFWWKVTEDKSLFEQRNVIYKYDPYSLKFEEPTYPNMIRVRRFVYLDIILGNSLLLDSGLIVDYHINVNSFDNLKDELFRIGEEAHNRFMVVFQERRFQSCISPTYTPTFDPSVLETKIESVLQTGDGL